MRHRLPNGHSPPAPLASPRRGRRLLRARAEAVVSLAEYGHPVLDPAYASWWSAVPAALVVAALLFVPGGVCLALLGTRARVAVAMGPVVTVTLLAVGGTVCQLAGHGWGAAALTVTVGLAWAACGAAGRWLRHRPDPLPRGGPDPGSASVRRGGLLRPAAEVGGYALAALVVGRVLVTASGDPRAFPQHPDTIFHLGTPQWMVRHHDISVLHSFGFTGATSRTPYPVGFHEVTATATMISGAPVVVVSSAMVLVMMGVVWPLGAGLLARSVLGPSILVDAVTPVLAVSFSAYPYTLMGFGVLWADAFGRALVPAVVAVAIQLLPRAVGASAGRMVPRQAVAWAAVVLALPGLGMAHPSALFDLVGFLALAVVTRLVLRWWPRRREGVRAVLPLLVALAATAAAVAAGVLIRPPSNVGAGVLGPELHWPRAIADTVMMAPRRTPYDLAVVVLVLVGTASVVRARPTALWCITTAGAFSLLFLGNVAVDDKAWRLLTWPWYNNALRISVVTTIPLVVIAVAGVDTVARALRREPSPVPFDRLGRLAPSGRRVVGATLALLVLAGATAWTRPRTAWVSTYFHPTARLSWATPSELASLARLSRAVPAGDLTAANPWDGGTYLYLVSDRALLWPTEKNDDTPDRRLLGLRLDRVGTDPRVCAAARREHVTRAITGGEPFGWATRRQLAMYAGVDRIGSSPAWRAVARDGEYTLYQLQACAP